MLALQAHDASLVLAPEQGGGILGWTRGRVALLRHASSRAVVPGDTREMAAFPLAPYSNRIAGGRFHFAETDYRLALNFGDHPNSIHGIGWQRAWLTTAITRDAATLTLHHAPDRDWPFAFSATQQFRLTPASLHVTLTITNLHTGLAPAGLGLHPYFPLARPIAPHAPTTLRFRADTYGTMAPINCRASRSLPRRHGTIAPGAPSARFPSTIVLRTGTAAPPSPGRITKD